MRDNSNNLVNLKPRILYFDQGDIYKFLDDNYIYSFKYNINQLGGKDIYYEKYIKYKTKYLNLCRK